MTKALVPKISILINSFNYCRYVAEAIDSVLRQDYKNFEVILVDDYSTDHSKEIIDSYGDKVKAIYLKTNKGQAHCINNGLPHCTGELVAMLDADDYFLPKKLSKIAELYNTDTSAVLFCDPCQQVNSFREVIGSAIPQNLPSGDLRDSFFKKGGHGRFPSMSGLTFSRKFLKKVIPQPELPHRVSFDHYLAYLASLTGNMVSTNTPYTVRRLHGRNKYKTKERMERRRDTVIDDKKRIERMAYYINKSLSELGEPRRINYKKNAWYQTQLYWLDEISFSNFLYRYIAHGLWQNSTFKESFRYLKHISEIKKANENN